MSGASDAVGAVVGVVALVGLGYGLWSYHTMKTELAEAQAKVSAYEEAAAIQKKIAAKHEAYAAKRAAVDAANASALSEMTNVEGGDAPVPDYLRAGAAVIDRLR